MSIKTNKILIFFLIVITTIIIGTIVNFYCEFFLQLDLLAKKRLLDHPELYIVITPLLFWVAAYICRKFSPYSSGNILDHLKEALEESKNHSSDQGKIKKLLNFRVAAISFISSLTCSFAGGALGREAPSVHMSASIFADIAGRVKNKIPQINVQNWIFAGSALGISVAFNAPVAGMVYITEKLLKNRYYDFRSNMFWTVVTMTTFILFLQRSFPVYQVENLNIQFSYYEIFLIILIATVCGLTAFGFKKINNSLYKRFTSIKSNLWHLVPIIAGLLVAAISLYCGIYSFSGGINTANEALASTEVLLSYKEVIGRILNTIITFVSGAAGGLVAPAITIGAGIASIIGSLFDVLDVKILMLIGMATFLAIILGEPISAAVIICESTDQSMNVLPFLIFANLVSILAVKIIKSSKLKILNNEQS